MRTRRQPPPDPYDVVALVGPSHFVAFEGVAVYPGGAFDSPLGLADDRWGRCGSPRGIGHRPQAQAGRTTGSTRSRCRFRSCAGSCPDVPIVPMLMGFQSRRNDPRPRGGADGGVQESPDAARREHRSLALLRRGDRGRLRRRVSASASPRSTPKGCWISSRSIRNTSADGASACGGGPAIAVMLAARAMGATTARVLKYAHSGEVSGDYGGVVGYLAAAMGRPVS